MLEAGLISCSNYNENVYGFVELEIYVSGYLSTYLFIITEGSALNLKEDYYVHTRITVLQRVQSILIVLHLLYKMGKYTNAVPFR